MKKWILLTISLVLGPAGFAKSWVYISLKTDDKVAIYSEDEVSGKLTRVATEKVMGGPASIAVTADKSRMYIARRNDRKISCYAIDPETGALTFQSEMKAIDNPVYIALDQTERYLLSAYFSASKMALYSIAEDGTLSSKPVFEEDTPDNPHAIQVNASNDVLYVTCMGGDRILKYRFSSKTGEALLEQKTVTPEKTGPRHFVFSPDAKHLFVANEVASSVTRYTISSTGSLSQLETLSTLPDDFSGANKCADIHITPNGKFLYVTNRGADSIAAYNIGTDAALSLIGFYATEKTPREMEIDATGSYLFAAGETSGKLQSYKIDPETGKLSPLQNLSAGNGPVWVEAVTLQVETNNTSFNK